MQPYQIVEKPGFKKMVSKLDLKYQLPTRKYFSNNEIPHMYSEMVEKVKKDISTVKYFAAMTDLWTSTANQPYLSCTIHFINECGSLSLIVWTLCLFLQTTLVPTCQKCCKKFFPTGDYVDPGKLVATTTDNGSNFIVTLSCLEWLVVLATI